MVLTNGDHIYNIKDILSGTADKLDSFVEAMGDACEMVSSTEAARMAAARSIRLFPNPTADLLNIENLDQSVESASVDLVSVEGRTVLTKQAITYKRALAEHSERHR